MSRTEYEEALFQRYCRQPRTRINGIMTLIESGYSDAEIAHIVGKEKADGSLDTKPYDIAVYRKALHGDLCRLMAQDDSDIQEPVTSSGLSKEARDRLILTLYGRGYKASELAKLYGVTQTHVYKIAREGGWSGRRSKKGVKLRC